MMDSPIRETSRIGALSTVKDGHFTEALQAEETALKIAQDQLGPLHPSLVPILNDMATLRRYLADYAGAERDYKWGIALLEQNPTAEDSQLAGSLEYLAGLYVELNRLTEAEILLKRALSLRQLSGKSRALAQTWFLLGGVEGGLHRETEAQNHLRLAKEFLEKDSHPDPLLSISLWNLLARINREKQNFPETQICLEKSLAIAHQNFDDQGLEVASALVHLADFFRSQGQEDKAAPLYASVLPADTRYVGSYTEFPALPHLKQLAAAYQRTGKPVMAGGLWQKILLTEKKVFGPRHPSVAIDLFHLGEVEAENGRRAQALKDMEQSLGILRDHFDGDHPLVLLVQTRLKKLKF